MRVATPIKKSTKNNNNAPLAAVNASRTSEPIIYAVKSRDDSRYSPGPEVVVQDALTISEPMQISSSTVWVHVLEVIRCPAGRVIQSAQLKLSNPYNWISLADSLWNVLSAFPFPRPVERPQGVIIITSAHIWWGLKVFSFLFGESSFVFLRVRGASRPL